jgi:hypothetical protein
VFKLQYCRSHRFDADPDPEPDPTFHYDADPDPDPDPIPSFTHVGKSIFFNPQCQFTLFLSFSVASQVLSLLSFQYLGQYCEIFWKKYRTVYFSLKFG